jgi:hypothetical protein
MTFPDVFSVVSTPTTCTAAEAHIAMRHRCDNARLTQ